MISPAVRTSHCSGVKNLAKVLVPGDDVVEQVPMLQSWVHPSDLVNILVFESRVGDYQVFLCAETAAADHWSSPCRVHVSPALQAKHVCFC